MSCFVGTKGDAMHANGEIRPGEETNIGRSFCIRPCRGIMASTIKLLSSLRCNCETFPCCFSIWSFLSCMELAWRFEEFDIMSSNMQKLCYHKRLKCMSNGPFGGLASGHMSRWIASSFLQVLDMAFVWSICCTFDDILIVRILPYDLSVNLA